MFFVGCGFVGVVCCGNFSLFVKILGFFGEFCLFVGFVFCVRCGFCFWYLCVWFPMFLIVVFCFGSFY